MLLFTFVSLLSASLAASRSINPPMPGSGNTKGSTSHSNPTSSGGRNITIPTSRNCAVALSNKQVTTKEQVYQAAVVAHAGFRVLALASPTVNVHWHVISQDSSLDGGSIPDSRITDQMNVLNADYARTGLKFKLASTTRTINSDWFNNAFPGNQEESDMKKSLRKGAAHDLNVYTVAFNNGEGFVGHAYLPSDIQTHGLIQDGVMIHPETMPGGSFGPYSLGRTLVHETGHWLGLYHTFQGGCAFPNDMVDDTPAEASGADGCPTGRDSCPGLPGLDPIHNFMDYSEDGCMSEFTPGQINRIKSQISIFRNIGL